MKYPKNVKISRMPDMLLYGRGQLGSIWWKKRRPPPFTFLAVLILCLYSILKLGKKYQENISVTMLWCCITDDS